MKKQSKNRLNSITPKTKLVFKRDTVLNLTATQLQHVAGASGAAGCTSGEPACDTWTH